MVGLGPPRHLAHLSNLAHIARAVRLAQTHFGRPAHVATLASKTQLAITIITMAIIIIIITTALVSPKYLPAESRNSLANNGGSRHMRRHAEKVHEHPFPPRFKVDALDKIAAKYN